MSLELLIKKSLRLDESAGNISLISSISEYDTNDVLTNPDTFYEKREELSGLIKSLERIGKAAGSKIEVTPKLTIRNMYDQVRVAVASADKKENI